MKVVNANLSKTVKSHPKFVMPIFTKRQNEDLKETHLTTHYGVCYSVLRTVETLAVSGETVQKVEES